MIKNEKERTLLSFSFYLPGIFTFLSSLLFFLFLVSFTMLLSFDSDFENWNEEEKEIRDGKNDSAYVNLINNTEFLLSRHYKIHKLIRKDEDSYRFESIRASIDELKDQSALTPSRVISRRLKIHTSLMLNTDEYSIFYSDVFRKIPHGWPLKKEQLKINSRYGWREKPFFSSEKKEFHKGLDFKAAIGESVFSTADGVIKIARSETGGYGRLVVVEHASGFTSYYAHLNKIFVRKNQIIPAGFLIGESGNTGYSTGPHLHYEIRKREAIMNPDEFISY